METYSSDDYTVPVLSQSAVARCEATIVADGLECSLQRQYFTLNVSGPPAIGKTTLISRIASELKSRGYSVAILREDDAVLSRATRLELSLSGINPNAFDLSRLLSYFQRIVSGRAVQVPNYDHAIGGYAGSSRLEKPSSFILLDGTIWRHKYLFSRIRIQHLALLVPQTMFQWKEIMMKRDRFERGYSPKNARVNFRNYIRDLREFWCQLNHKYNRLYALMSISEEELDYLDVSGAAGTSPLRCETQGD